MKPKRPQPTLLPILLATAASAAFIGKFDNMVHGESVLLAWEELGAEFQPLYIQAFMYNGSAGGGYNVVTLNLTDSHSGSSSFLWENVPFPLEYFPSAQYEVRLLPHTPIVIDDDNYNGPPVPVSDSGLFHVYEESNEPSQQSSTSPDSDNTSDNTSGSSGSGSRSGSDGGSDEPSILDPDQPSEVQHRGEGVNKMTLGIALGVTIPSLIALAVVGYLLWKRRERMMAEKRRTRRFETVIH